MGIAIITEVTPENMPAAIVESRIECFKFRGITVPRTVYVGSNGLLYNGRSLSVAKGFDERVLASRERVMGVTDPRFLRDETSELREDETSDVWEILKTHELTYSGAMNIVTAMIRDAKNNMIRISRSRTKNKKKLAIEMKEFGECQSWLQNGNGGLELLLLSSGVPHTRAILKALNDFAEEGYKTATIEEED
jgi:hypothetical protein